MSASRFHAVRKILKLEDLGPPFAGSVPQKPYPSVPEYIRARHPARAEVDAGQAFYPTNRSINSRVWLIQADITKLKIDAVVNAANEQLRGGGGIDGAIHRAAGPELIQACGKLNGCPTGQAKITPGFKLPSRFVVHTVGPIGEKFESLRSAYHNSLEVAFNQPLPDPLEPGQQTILGKRPRDPEPIRTVALCGISTGIYGYPLVNASHTALNTVREWLEDEKNREKVDAIIFCTFLDKEFDVYNDLMNYYFPGGTAEAEANPEAKDEGKADEKKPEEEEEEAKEEKKPEDGSKDSPAEK